MSGQFTSDAITSAGLAVGVAIFGVQHYRWWRGSGAAAPAVAGGGKGGKGAAPAAAGKALDPMALIPLWAGIAFGTLMVACPAGLLGTGAGVLRWGGNGIGDMVMSTMTGKDAPALATSSPPQLDANGALVVTTLVIVLWLLRKAFPKVTKGKFKAGTLCGVLLCIGTGVFAAIGNFVIPGANDLGAWALNGITHGTFV